MSNQKYGPHQATGYPPQVPAPQDDGSRPPMGNAFHTHLGCTDEATQRSSQLDLALGATDALLDQLYDLVFRLEGELEDHLLPVGEDTPSGMCEPAPEQTTKVRRLTGMNTRLQRLNWQVEYLIERLEC